MHHNPKACPRPLNGGIFAPNHVVWSGGPVIVQPKFDGFRCIITRDGAFSRHGKRLPFGLDFADRLIPKLADDMAWFDCELLGTRDGNEIALVVFDIRMRGDLTFRQTVLSQVLRDQPTCKAQVDAKEGEIYQCPNYQLGMEAWQTCRERQLEGVVVKYTDSRYPLGQTSKWVKFRYITPGNH